MDQGRRYDELDGYRGLAALAIVAYHAYQDPRIALGWFYPDDRPLFALGIGHLHAAVAWFFVLSGFLLFLPFARAALDGTPPPAPGAFLRRRAWRIYPLYATVFIVVWVLGYDGSHLARRDLWAHLTFAHIFSDDLYMRTVGPAWSLADEAIYYACLALIGPLLATACGRIGRRYRAPLAASLILALVAGSIAHSQSTGLSPAAQHGPFAKFAPFGIGMLLALVAAALARPLRPRAAHWLRWAALLLLAGIFVARPIAPLVGRHFDAWSGLAFALLMASTVLAARDAPWTRALASRPLSWLGALSYGLYLWHQPIELTLLRHGWLLGGTRASYAADLAILLALCLPLAALTYRAIELPALAAGARLAGRRTVASQGRAATPAPSGPTIAPRH